MSIPVILEVIDVALEIADIIKTVDESANADTPIMWGDCISGTCYYYYVDNSGSQTEEHGRYSFNTSIHDGYALMAGAHVSAVAKRTDNASGTAPSINYYPVYNTAVWNGGSYYTVDCTINGITGEFLNVQTVPRSYANVMFYADGTTNISGSVFPVGNPEDVSFTTIPAVANNNPSAVYLPVSGQSLSYNDMRQNLVVYANDIILSETDTDGETVYNDSDTINIYDLPEFESESESEPESESEFDPTEPDYQPVSINYDEILSEDELESILNQESYNIPEIESISETVIIDIEDLVIEDDTEYRKIMEFVPDALAAGMSVFNELEIAPPLISTAIVACIWKIIKGV